MHGWQGTYRARLLETQRLETQSGTFPSTYACAQLAVEPRRCIFVGDDKNDMLAGSNAGIKTVAVTYGYGNVEQNWNYDYKINHVQELLELI